MRKQDYLVELIHSMSAGERRYFKVFNSPQKGSKKYEKLFDELVLAENYDVAILCRKLKVTRSELGHLKSYLQQVVFKALRNFHESEPHISLLNEMANAHLLFHRTLMPWASEIAGKTA